VVHAAHGAGRLLVPQVKANPNLTNSLISYWPMDTIQSGVLTPDVVRGYNLLGYGTAGPGSPVNLTTVNSNVALISGIRRQRGCAERRRSKRTRTFSTRTLLAYIAQTGDQLPILQWSNFTLSFWVNIQNTNPPSIGGQPTRVFGEYNRNDNNPFFNLEQVQKPGTGQF